MGMKRLPDGVAGQVRVESRYIVGELCKAFKVVLKDVH
jgi:hypothetical protein